jgi:hypothetical protein
MPPASLQALSARTHLVYERRGLQFDAERSRGLLERKWLERVAAHLPPGGSVLDHASMDMVEHVVDDPDCDYATVLLARKRQPPAGARSRGA